MAMIRDGGGWNHAYMHVDVGYILTQYGADHILWALCIDLFVFICVYFVYFVSFCIVLLPRHS